MLVSSTDTPTFVAEAERPHVLGELEPVERLLAAQSAKPLCLCLQLRKAFQKLQSEYKAVTDEAKAEVIGAHFVRPSPVILACSEAAAAAAAARIRLTPAAEQLLPDAG